MPADRRKTSGLAMWFGLALLAFAEVAAALAMTAPATAQSLDDRFPFMENRRRLYQPQPQRQQERQQDYDPGWSYQEQRRQAPSEATRAPAARRPDVAPTTNIIVFGDAMSEWLAYGLEDAFGESPEIGVTRKLRPNTGLIRTEVRNESYDWPSATREILNAEKPDFIVMMLGLSDRRGIREAIRQPARPPAGQKKDATPPAQAAAPAAAPAQPAKPPVDTEAPQQDEQPSIMAPEGAVAGTLTHEFRSEKWGELYSRRIDEMIGVMKAKGVPVFWVGLPAVRGSRATSEAVYLNDLYRGRAEKAGITYVDIWDGFVDESGSYNNYGPDFEGQTRRLRTGDGTNFTRAGARKLAHYVEREIRRVMLARAAPAAAPLPQEPEPDAKAPPAAAAPGLPPRPIASPVMSLTAPPNTGDTLLGGAASRTTMPDSIVTRVLVKGEPVEAPAGRADDFVWPRRDVITATGVLPPDPLPPEPEVATKSAPSEGRQAAAPAAAPAAPRQTPRAPRERTTENGWRPWGQTRQEERPRANNGWNNGGGFFGGWFGR